MAVIRRTDGASGAKIRLEGICPVEDAETLLALLLDDPQASVDWSACTRLHTAVYQILLSLQPGVVGVCADPFVTRWLTRAPG
ncbi:hypothetical protein PMNALOAF_2666 [Methylobacterium adhaesivum]|jgi:hypothetical protein|uniref:Uncharacterized protein n=1 Tax=Methylobacterium adhaesivum TaxID=333297 RepID=A0ABT8BIN5_9HYPH|nr:hypothetical protein [Methylobacterium adhaesivum]MDN3592023.1 hypothetical protein [Methylobacterium adhaesivum]GJD31409.1 hypothetical protein PMNALOAF_2666 [Methylobacterium adhaesivum]